MAIGPTGLLHVNPKLPGAILSEPPREITITPRGKEVNLEQEMGVSISIPRNATEKEEQMYLTTSFSGAYEMPDGVESVSPGYIIKTTREVEFSKEVEVKLQHIANLETAEDFKDVAVYKANPVPRHKACCSSDPIHKFEELKGTEVEVGECFVKMKLKRFASTILNVVKRKRKSECQHQICVFDRFS